MEQIKDKQYWLQLCERYFEAGTSDEEERALKQFAARTADPDFRELQAVMGFTSMGRAQNLTPPKPQNPKTSKPQNLKTSKPQNPKTSKPQNLISIAASVIVVLGLSLFFSLSNRRQDTGCEAWVNGEKITDPTAVMALMQNTMRDMDIEGNNPVEDQLRDMFDLLLTPQTVQTL